MDVHFFEASFWDQGGIYKEVFGSRERKIKIKTNLSQLYTSE